MASSLLYMTVIGASLTTMLVIALSFLFGSHVEFPQKLLPRMTSFYISLSMLSDPGSWTYSKIVYGDVYNVRSYYGIIDVNKVMYDVVRCPFNETICVSICSNYSSPEICRQSCENLISEMNLNRSSFCETKYSYNLENDILEFTIPYIEGNDLLEIKQTINLSEETPEEYSGVGNYIMVSIPKFELLPPYIIEIKVYDMDYLRYNVERKDYYDPEDSLIGRFVIPTYCGSENPCRVGNKLYELSFPALLTNGKGLYWDGFVSVRIYEWA